MAAKPRTFSNSRYCDILVAVCLLEGKQNVHLGPVRKHLLDQAGLVPIELAEFSKLSIVAKGRRGLEFGLLVLLITISSTGGASAPAGEAAAATATRASAARGSGPGLDLRHAAGGWGRGRRLERGECVVMSKRRRWSAVTINVEKGGGRWVRSEVGDGPGVGAIRKCQEVWLQESKICRLGLVAPVARRMEAPDRVAQANKTHAKSPESW